MSDHKTALLVATVMPCAVTFGLPTTNETNVPAKVNQLANFPLNFLRTGVYEYVDGKVHYRATNGGWSSTTRNSITNAYSMYMNLTNILAQANNECGRGFALRCVLDSALFLKKRALR